VSSFAGLDSAEAHLTRHYRAGLSHAVPTALEPRGRQGPIPYSLSNNHEMVCDGRHSQIHSDPNLGLPAP